MIEGFEKACKKALEILPGILSILMVKTKLLIILDSPKLGCLNEYWGGSLSAKESTSG